MFRSIWKSGETKREIRRSVFIGRASPVASAEEAERWIAKICSEEPTATHHCTAYIVGEMGIVQKYDDNGEPQGTAGLPILEVIRKEELTNVCVVVTRYFGGIKLGASGLIRAYTQVCREAVHASRIVNYRPFTKVKATFSYAALGKIEHALSGYQELGREYEDQATIDYLLPSQELDTVRARLLDLTSGSVIWNTGEEQEIPTDEQGHPLV